MQRTLDARRPAGHGFRRVVLPLVIGLAVAGIRFAGISEHVLPPQSRPPASVISAQQQADLGVQALHDIVNRQRDHIVWIGADAEAVKRVGTRLAAVTDAAGFAWEFILIDSPEVNAYCLPGGKVVVYTGILPLVQNETGLAALMAHEIAHSIAEHSAARIRQYELEPAVQGTLATSLSRQRPVTRASILAAFGAGAPYGLLWPYSSSQEAEADQIALLAMARAGYDPREAIAFWERLANSANAPEPAAYPLLHLTSEARIALLYQRMPEAIRVYRRATSDQQ